MGLIGRPLEVAAQARSRGLSHHPIDHRLRSPFVNMRVLWWFMTVLGVHDGQERGEEIRSVVCRYLSVLRETRWKVRWLSPTSTLNRSSPLLSLSYLDSTRVARRFAQDPLVFVIS